MPNNFRQISLNLHPDFFPYLEINDYLKIIQRFPLFFTKEEEVKITYYFLPNRSDYIKVFGFDDSIHAKELVRVWIDEIVKDILCEHVGL